MVRTLSEHQNSPYLGYVFFAGRNNSTASVIAGPDPRLSIGSESGTLYIHGAEMAARCASIDTIVCGDQTATQSYAAQEALASTPHLRTLRSRHSLAARW